MFDAFAKIDGGGAGRDAGDDLRIELREWLLGYKSVSNYGFVALEQQRNFSMRESMIMAVVSCCWMSGANLSKPLKLRQALK